MNFLGRKNNEYKLIGCHTHVGLLMVCKDWCDLLQQKREKRGDEKWMSKSVAVTGSVARLEWALMHGYVFHKSLMLSGAARWGAIDVLNWVEKIGNSLRARVGVRSTIAHGQTAALKWLISRRYSFTCDAELFPENMQDNLELWQCIGGCNFFAAKHGFLRIMKRAVQAGMPLNNESFVIAAINAHRHILCWIAKHHRAFAVIAPKYHYQIDLPMREWLEERGFASRDDWVGDPLYE